MTDRQKAKATSRKTYVSQAIQGRFLRRLACYWVFYHLFLLHGLFLAQGLFVEGRVASFTEAYTTFMAQQLPLIVCAAVVFPIILRDMLKMTNRVAGPFVRFERALKEMMRGEKVETITLRKRDMTHEFQDVLNEFINYHNQMLNDKIRRSEESSGWSTPSDDRPVTTEGNLDMSQADDVRLESPVAAEH